MSNNLLLKPRMSEKAYNSSLELNVYVFDVPVASNKLTIANAVEAQFAVKVKDVKVMVVKGKVKKSYQKRNRPVEGVRAKRKKAYVRLFEGQTINVFGEDKESKKDVKSKPSKKESK